MATWIPSCVKEMNPNLNAMIIEIGDISDIAYCVKTKELLDDPGAYFPKYKMVFEKEEWGVDEGSKTQIIFRW